MSCPTSPGTKPHTSTFSHPTSNTRLVIHSTHLISNNVPLKDAKPPRSYASRLTKDVVPYGATGLPETFDTSRVLNYKLKKLTQWVRESENIVFFTGAGISTSCAIDDFRGSVNGVWSREVRGESVPEYDESFLMAVPSLSHMAIYEMSKHKNVHVVTQNVDDLHRRSGLSQDRIMELHGNLFVEECRKCQRRYYRNFDVQGMGLKETGEKCPQCGGPLHDFCLDWLDALPDDDFEKARDVCSEADLVICLGTSLRVEPANKIPQRALRNGGRMVIVNLQETPKDEVASMKINGLCDVVLKSVMQSLQLKVPNYVHHEELLVKVSAREGRILRVTEPNATSTDSESTPSTTDQEAEPNRTSLNGTASPPTQTPLRPAQPVSTTTHKPTTIKKRKRKDTTTPQKHQRTDTSYVVEISEDDPVDRLIYCKSISFWAVGDKRASLQTLHNHGIEHSFHFFFSPQVAESAKEFKVEVEWHPRCNLTPLSIQLPFTSELTSQRYRVKVFDVDYESLTEDELSYRVPIARKRFYDHADA